MLEGRDKMIYQAAINVLVLTLKSGNDNAAVIQDKLNTLSSQLGTIETVMKETATALVKTAEGKSDEFEDWASDMRAKVYGGCVASILCPPCVIPCYAIAAGILESEIDDYKEETEAFVKDFNSWATTFTGMAEMAVEASTVSKDWYLKVTDFKNVISVQYDLIKGTAEYLWVSHEMRQIVSNDLVALIEACDKIIVETTGKLEGEDEMALNAEFSSAPKKSLQFDELTEE